MASVELSENNKRFRHMLKSRKSLKMRDFFLVIPNCSGLRKCPLDLSFAKVRKISQYSHICPKKFGKLQNLYYFAPVNGNKVNVKVNFMYIRSCQPLLQIHCLMPGVINSLTFGDSRTIWQMPTSLLWINSHSSVNEVWVPWNLNQNCLASGNPQR